MAEFHIYLYVKLTGGNLSFFFFLLGRWVLCKEVVGVGDRR